MATAFELRQRIDQISQDREQLRADLKRVTRERDTYQKAASDFDETAKAFRDDRDEYMKRAEQAEADLSEARSKLTTEEAAHLQTIDQRDRFEEALSKAHIALGGDGDWVAKIPPVPPPNSGDLAVDVPVLGAELLADLSEALEELDHLWDGGCDTGCKLCDRARMRLRSKYL